MRSIRIILLLSLAIACVANSLTAGGWQYSGVGARAKAMGNAYRAISDDWSGVYYNPAGLAFMNKNTLTLTAETMSLRPEVKPNFKVDGYSIGYLDGQIRYPDDKVLLIGEAGLFIKPVSLESIVFGMSVYQSFDHNANMNLFHPCPAYNDGNPVAGDNHKSNLDVITFHPAIAMKFSEDRFSVGVGLAIHRGDILLNQIRLVDNPYEYPLNVRPYEKFATMYSVDGFGFGVGFNAGVQFRPNERLRVGVSYSSATTITMDGDSREYVYLPKNNGIANLYNDDQATPAEIERQETYLGNSFRADGKFEVDLKLPSEFGIGAAYQVSEKVLISGDFAYTMWSDFEDFEIAFSERVFPYGTYDTWKGLLSDVSIPFAWDDVVKVGFGVEGILSERFTLRGGYMFDQSPIPDETFNEIFMDTGDKHCFNAGLKFTLSKSISFDAAFQAILYAERDITEVVDYNGDGYFDNFGGNFKNKSFFSTWALNYRF